MTRYGFEWEPVEGKDNFFRRRVSPKGKEYEYIYRVKLLDGLGTPIDTWRKLNNQRQPFRTLREAETHRKALVEELMTRTQQSAGAPKSRTLEAVFESYMENRGAGLTPNTISKWRGNMENHAIPYFKHRNIKTITVGEVKNFVLQMRRDYAWSTVQSVVTTMALVWQYAREMGIVSRETYLDLFVDKATKIKVPKKMPGEQEEKQKPPVTYTDEQLQRFYSYAQEQGTEFYVLLLLCYLGGVRLSEALGLCWSDINWDTGEITVARQLMYDKNTHQTYLNTTKSQTNRTFIMHEKLKATLLAWQAEQRDVCGGEQVTRVKNQVTGLDVPSSDFILCRKGGIITHSAANHFREGLKKKVDDSFFFHGLRHTIISNLAASGVPLKDISEFVGHAYLETTDKHYWATTKASHQKLLTALQAI